MRPLPPTRSPWLSGRFADGVVRRLKAGPEESPIRQSRSGDRVFGGAICRYARDPVESMTAETAYVSDHSDEHVTEFRTAFAEAEAKKEQTFSTYAEMAAAGMLAQVVRGDAGGLGARWLVELVVACEDYPTR